MSAVRVEKAKATSTLEKNINERVDPPFDCFSQTTITFKNKIIKLRGFLMVERNKQARVWKCKKTMNFFLLKATNRLTCLLSLKLF